MQVNDFMKIVYQKSEKVFIKVVTRKSYPEVFCKKRDLKNFARFTGKNLCLRPGTLLKKKLRHMCFLVKFAKFLRTAFL